MSSIDPPPPRDSLGTTFKRIVRRLVVPNNVGVDEAAMIIGSDLPPCMASVYSSAILWRPNGTVSSNRLYYFIAQPRIVITQTVDHGFLWYNGTDCGYVVMERREGFFFNPNLIRPITTLGKVFASASVAFSTQPDFNYKDAHMFFDTNSVFDINATAKALIYNKFLSLEQDTKNGACTASQNVNVGTFANYPTAVQCNVTKQGSATETGFEIEYAQTFFVSVADTGPLFGVNANGPSGSIDFTTHRVPGATPVGVRLSSVGFVKTGGLLPGAYVFTP